MQALGTKLALQAALLLLLYRRRRPPIFYAHQQRNVFGSLMCSGLMQLGFRATL